MTRKWAVYFKLECIDERGISSIAVSSGAAYLINPSWFPCAQLGVLCDSELTRHGLAPFWPTLGPRLWHTKQFVFLREDHEKKKSLSKVKEEAAKWENTFARPLLFDMRKQININNPYLFRRSTTALALDIGWSASSSMGKASIFELEGK